MKKIKLYCYKSRISGSYHEYDKKLNIVNDAYSFEGSRTIELDEPHKEEPKRIEGWISRNHFLNGGDSECRFSKQKYTIDDTKLVELRSNERILSRDEVYNSIRTKLVVASFLLEQVLKDLGFDNE
jgi:hypothetical protein